MTSPAPPAPRRSRRRDIPIEQRVREAVQHATELLGHVSDPLDRRLLTEMVESVYQLGVDQTTTGDLKILNSALKELRHAFKIFRPYRHVRKVAIFGSARTPREDPHYRQAVRTARLLRDAGWLVITGAASGIMQAGHEGAGSEASFGVNIRLPFEQEANPIIAKDPKLMHFKYFFSRKLIFLKESHATMLFPGGFGTLDEGFESLTLVQTGKSEPRPIVLVDVPGGSYWKTMLRFFERQLCDSGMISKEDRSLYRVVTSPEAACDAVVAFYSRYHSIRYVGDETVIRLMTPLSIALMKTLSREFRDILASGEFHRSGPLPDEVEDNDLVDLPRVVFRFNRSSFGRLRQLIDRINSF